VTSASAGEARADAGAPRVALTFDAEHPDRPTQPGVAERLIERLGDARVAATFFVQGRWAEAYPATARAIAAGGHLVGNHSHYHARMPLLSDAGLAEDIDESGRVIAEVVGVDPRPWFRCPFGAGARDERVQAAVRGAGYRHVGWHIAAEDWEPDRDGAAIEHDVVAGVTAHGDGAVVLLHSWPKGTLDAAASIVGRLRSDGFRFVRVDELDEVPTAPSWA
jgi:peptidoglycan-N-acetylglucosamine deacetylase